MGYSVPVRAKFSNLRRCPFSGLPCCEAFGRLVAGVR